jgi:Ni,Fe-hydrogenase III large subunit
VPFILAAEKLMGIDAPARAQWIRTILFELSRIANVSLFLGDLGVQLGAITPVFMAFRDREYVLNLIESATGGRFHPNFDRIGGLKDDLPAGWVDETKAVMKKLRNFCDEIESLLFGNEIFQSRTDRHHSKGRCPRLRTLWRKLASEWRRLGLASRPREPACVEQGRLEGVDAPRRRQFRSLLGPFAGDP